MSVADMEADLRLALAAVATPFEEPDSDKKEGAPSTLLARGSAAAPPSDDFTRDIITDTDLNPTRAVVSLAVLGTGGDLGCAGLSFTVSPNQSVPLSNLRDTCRAVA